MTPERYREFVERIMAEGETLDNHYRENPELAHFTRLADAMGTIVNYELCGTMRKAINTHWNCLVSTSTLQRYLYAFVTIKPRFLDELYEEFQEDFKETIPDGYLMYRVLECREYPIPEELTIPPQQEPN